CSGPLPTCTTILGTTITQSSQIPTGILSGTICIVGDFTISSGNAFTFLNATILISPEVEIKIDPLASLVIDNSDLHGCNGLWKGIKLSNNTAVYVFNNSLIEDARKAISASYVTALVSVTNSTFNRNLTGIWLEDSPNAANPTYISNLYDVKFTCNAPIVGTIKEISDYGIYSMNCPVSYQHSSEEDDHDVLFRNLKYGIKIEGERSIDLVGNHFYFREIRYAGIDMNRGEIELEESIFANYGDYGILARKLRGLLLSGCDFQLIETDPKFFPAPSPLIRSAVVINTDWNFGPGEFPRIDILNNCSFVYDCPGVDETYWGINAGNIGNRFDMLVYDNDFVVEGQNAQGIHITGGYLIGSEIDILGNRFTVNGPEPFPNSVAQCYGIAADFDITNLDIVGNDFNGENEPGSLDIRSHCVNLTSTIGFEEYENQITDNTFFGGFTTGVFVQNSDYWKICSNFSLTTDAYYFVVDNIEIDFIQNDIVLGNLNIYGKVFTQEQRDNKFFGFTNAVCFSGNCNVFSRFLVRQPLGTEWYPLGQLCGDPAVPCNPNERFFINQQGNAPQACAAEFNDPGDDELMEQIASGLIDNPNEYPAKIWRYKNFLYDKLIHNTELAQSHPSFITFMQNEALSSLGQFQEVRRLLQEGLMGTASGFDLSKLQSAAQINNAIPTPTIFEQNQKVVNQIILTAFLTQNGIFSEQQIITLQGIATQCYKAGGLAVIQAASLLNGCAKTTVDFDQNCGDEWPLLPSQNELEERHTQLNNTEVLDVSQYANELIIHSPELQFGILRIYDIMGNIVFSQMLLGTEGPIRVSTTSLVPSVYFISFSGSQKFTAKTVISN
ncbi:MAG TPA: hypothetical protein DCF33_12990, partial [Saprospirales bacterium]|nr:hypothetical protein [Saprospirales bacterium]